MGDALAREVLRLDGLFLQDGLKFGREPVEEHLVGEQNLAVEIVIRERELILGFKERVGENREDRVFLGRDDTLLQGRVELGVGDALRVGADRVEGGEKPRGGRHADLDALEVFGLVDDDVLRRRLAEAVVEHRQTHAVVFGEALVHPVHDEAVDHAVGVVVVFKEEGRRHGVQLLRVHRHVAERDDGHVKGAERHLFRKRRLVAQFARGIDLDLHFVARAFGDVLRKELRRLVVGVRNRGRVGQADRKVVKVGGVGLRGDRKKDGGKCGAEKRLHG